MERWTGVLKVPLCPNSSSHYRIAASLCLNHLTNTLAVPYANAIFFNGDRVEGTGNPIIEKLSNIQNIVDILVSKFGSSINAWVIEAYVYNGPFAVYSDFIPSVNQRGEPKSYNPNGFPASTSMVTLLSNCLDKANSLISGKEQHQFSTIESSSHLCPPKTIILGFSKGGTVLNQLLTELSFLDYKKHEQNQPNRIIPSSHQSLLNSISEVHYVDVGLNSAGAYITDLKVIERISKRLIMQGDSKMCFFIHGTPRQWCDNNRVFIRKEKDSMVQMLKSEAGKIGEEKLQVCEKFYFCDKSPNLQMHFEIIEAMNVIFEIKG